MGVQPRPFAVAESETDKSPSVRKATSPASRKRRYMDVVLVGDATQEDADEERELAQRVSFKRAKSDEPSLRVHVREIESAPRDSESFEPITPTASSTGGSSPRDKTSPSAKTPARPNMSASQTITLDMLRPHFEKPLAQVAQVFGICVTLLKKICRKNGLARWPHRQIIGLRKSIASMEQAIGHFEGARRESYAQQLDKQRNKLAALLEDPTKCNLLAVDDEYLPSQPTTTMPPVAVRSSTVPSHMPAQPTTYYAAYSHTAPAPVYQRAPVGYVDYYHAPGHQQATYAPHHHYYPGSYAPAPQYHHVQHQQHYHSPTQPSSAMLPPLRTDARQALPSLSALVGRRW